MNATEQTPGMDPNLRAKMQEACERLAKGIYPTMAERRAAAATIDQMREENGKIFGVQNVTLDAVRESRRTDEVRHRHVCRHQDLCRRTGFREGNSSS